MLDLRESWVPTQAEFDAFAKVSGDDNAIHVDPEVSARTSFGRTVSHGMLIYAKLWGMLRRHNPALVQYRQALLFPNPAFAGEELVLTISGDVPGLLSMTASRALDGAACLVGEADVSC